MLRERAFWCALGLLLVLQCLFLWQLHTPQPLSADAASDEFSAGRAFAVLQRLLGDQQPHPAGSEANAQVRARLVKELEDLELDVQVLRCEGPPSYPVQLVNVLARLPAQDAAGRPLVLATHYDSVSAGPGAADAGCCVVALLETARILQFERRCRRPVYFLFTDGEEDGLLGARQFVETHPLTQQRPFVLNFEARGASGPSLMFETHQGNLAAVRTLANHLARPRLTGSPFVSVYRTLPNDTDFTVFRQAGWAGFNFAFIDDPQRYHTAQDNLDNLRLRSLQHHGENALALARHLARTESLELTPSAQDAVFFDLLGWYVLSYPIGWALPLSLVPVVVLLGSCYRRMGLSDCYRAIAAVVFVLLVALAVASVSGALLIRLLAAAGLSAGGVAPWRSAQVTIFVPISILVLWLATRYGCRYPVRQHLWAALWIVWSSLGVAVAVWQPGFSHFFLVPGLGAAFLSVFPVRLSLLVVISTLCFALCWLPLVNLLPVALGPQAAVIFHPVFVFLWLPVLPLFTRPECAREIAQINSAAMADTP